MKLFLNILVAALVTLVATSCAANRNSHGASATEITGPAFVLFYTEN